MTIHNPKFVGLLIFPNFKGEDWYVFTFTATEFADETGQKPVFFTTPEAERSGAEKTGFFDWESDEGHLQWIPDDEVESLRCGRATTFSCRGFAQGSSSQRSLFMKEM